MKMNLLQNFVILLLAVAVSCRFIRYKRERQWNMYKNLYAKEYNRLEDRIRRERWEENVNRIYQHNRNYRTLEVPYYLGPNEYSDLNDKEFQSTMMGLEAERNCDEAMERYHPPSNINPPESVDWKAEGYVTDVQNQGKCGACWAFTSVASLEGQYKRASGNLVKLSEQMLVDCSTNQGNSGCRGGQMCRALEYAAAYGGVVTEKAYPFTGRHNDSCRFDRSSIGAPVRNYLEVPTGDEDALHKAVGLLGPVAVGIDGSPHTFRHYRGGIYSDPNCRKHMQTHAVTLIGYGTENGVDYWLFKNSWGKSWGVKGFGKMLRNVNQCGITSRGIFPVV